MASEAFLSPPEFADAIEAGSVVESSGWHNPHELHNPNADPCGCEPTTRSGRGAYRDVVEELADGTVVHYYHQSPVVAIAADSARRRISACGWETASTKERINRYLLGSWSLRQRDGSWRITTPDGDEVTYSGPAMVINFATGEVE